MADKIYSIGPPPENTGNEPYALLLTRGMGMMGPVHALFWVSGITGRSFDGCEVSAFEAHDKAGKVVVQFPAGALYTLFPATQLREQTLKEIMDEAKFMDEPAAAQAAEAPKLYTGHYQ